VVAEPRELRAGTLRLVHAVVESEQADELGPGGAHDVVDLGPARRELADA